MEKNERQKKRKKDTFIEKGKGKSGRRENGGIGKDERKR